MSDSSGPAKTADDRAHERRDVNLTVRIRCADWGYASKVVALNASKGGVFLGTQKPPVVGSKVELILDLPDGAVLRLQGTVQHVVSPENALADGRAPGVGVKIDSKHSVDLILLDEMAAQFGGSAKQAAAPAPAASPPSAPAARLQPPAASPPSAPAVRAQPLAASPPSAPAVRAQPAPPAPAPPAVTTSTRPALGKPAGSAARAVGIDFGTSYSSVSVAIGDRVQLIPDEQGRTFMPTVVAFPEGAAPQIGWAARALLAQDPRRVVGSVKRLLGRKLSDPAVAGYLQSAAYKTQRGANDSILIAVDEKTYQVPEICSMVIARLRDLAASYLGQKVSEVVMTVPVSFTEDHRAALRRAAEAAKLKVIDIVEEPVAGALAYGVGHGKNEIVAVYDFGGGTFDFSVLDVLEDRFRVLGTAGDPWLGGDDFDSALGQEVADAFWRTHKIELRKRVVEWQRLLIACEGVKRKLTSDQTAELTVPAIVESPTAIDIRQRFDRPTFERLCQELLERSLAVCKEALEKVGLEPRDMTEVVIMGGVSRIPFIRSGASKFFERDLHPVVNPDEAVVLGAGLRAAMKVNHPVKGVVEGGR